MTTWETDRPEGTWTELGGGYPEAQLRGPCPVCGTEAGTFCFVNVREYREPCAATGWFGTVSRFPSVHTLRWEHSLRESAARNSARWGIPLQVRGAVLVQAPDVGAQVSLF